MRISDWSSDVCSSDLPADVHGCANEAYDGHRQCDAQDVQAGKARPTEEPRHRTLLHRNLFHLPDRTAMVRLALQSRVAIKRVDNKANVRSSFRERVCQ